MIEIKPYRTDLIAMWNEVLLNTRVCNFLFHRNYLDYHSDRFIDCSLIVTRNGKPIALLPANVNDDIVTTHAGLTYGGLLSTDELRSEEALFTFERIRDHYQSQGIKKLIYKATPYIFHRYPAQEDLYALFRLGAQVFRRDISSVIELNKPFKYSKGRKWSINKAKKAGISISHTEDLSKFHALLSSALRKFGAAPTHTLTELQLLQSRFPDEIVLYVAQLDGELLAGALIYDFGATVHTQYLATSESGREIGALDLLLSTLISDVYNCRQYFSFGISTENNGQVLNSGLVAQKEGFGARAIVHDFYELKL